MHFTYGLSPCISSGLFRRICRGKARSTVRTTNGERALASRLDLGTVADRLQMNLGNFVKGGGRERREERST